MTKPDRDRTSTATSSPVEGVSLRQLQVGGIEMRIAEAGTQGPLVLLCHGFPESWYSWRHQLIALAAEGFRAVAPDMRGYGGSSRPEAADEYSIPHLVGDLVQLVAALGESTAVIVGHDWGAAIAWHAALMRPDVFTAVAGLSVPFAPPTGRSSLAALRGQGIDDYYSQYFQAPGVAEAELERDVRDALRRIYVSASADGEGRVFTRLRTGTLLGNTQTVDRLPAWLGDKDLQYLTEEFTRTGFRSGLNWYRNIDRNAGLLSPWIGGIVRQPSLFLAGSTDDVLAFPWAHDQIADFDRTLPGLTRSIILERAGHWVQEERPGEVNEFLLEFLHQVRPRK